MIAAGSLTTHIGPMIVRRSTIGSSKCRRVQMVIGLVRKALSKPRAAQGLFARLRRRRHATRRWNGLAALSGSTSSFVNPFTTSLQNYPPLRETPANARRPTSHRRDLLVPRASFDASPAVTPPTAQDLYVRHGRQKARLCSLSAARDRPYRERLNKGWIMPVAHLPDRAVISIKGEDAVSFLAGLLTCAVDAGPTPRYGALLTPQGKIIADFFLLPAPQRPDARGDGQDGFLLDVAKLVAENFAEAAFALQAARQAGARRSFGRARRPRRLGQGVRRRPAALAFPDPRFAPMGWRVIAPAGSAFGARGRDAPPITTPIASGSPCPQGGRDFAFGDAFPHEASMDQLGGVDFDKGCYVGQEVVSRTQHRGSARNRVAALALQRRRAAPKGPRSWPARRRSAASARSMPRKVAPSRFCALTVLPTRSRQSFLCGRARRACTPRNRLGRTTPFRPRVRA